MIAFSDMVAKRLFDLSFSALGLLILSPLLLIISLCIMFDSGRPIMYRQRRVGRQWREFMLYKFRTMNFQRPEGGPHCSPKDDKRITRVGRYLRKYKLDELPQLYNVLKGDMSFVGPRPELPKFVRHYSDIFNEILKIKPGITDLSSIKFRNEFSFLNNEENDVEELYLTNILPQKLVINREYLEKQGFFYDMGLIFRTIYIVMFK